MKRTLNNKDEHEFRTSAYVLSLPMADRTNDLFHSLHTNRNCSETLHSIQLTIRYKLFFPERPFSVKIRHCFVLFISWNNTLSPFMQDLWLVFSKLKQTKGCPGMYKQSNQTSQFVWLGITVLRPFFGWYFGTFSAGVVVV